jgi:hypothetical protein
LLWLPFKAKDVNLSRYSGLTCPTHSGRIGAK